MGNGDHTHRLAGVVTTVVHRLAEHCVSLSPELSPSPRSSSAKEADSVSITVVYWDDIDLDRRNQTPRICNRCNDLADAWRGRFDNFHAALRACALQGGFKDYVSDFLLLGPTATMHFKLHTMYDWLKGKRTKVLTERVILGTVLESYRGDVDKRQCGVVVANTCGHWKDLLRAKAAKLQSQANEAEGQFAALMLNMDGDLLDLATMRSTSQPQDNVQLKRLLIIVGGPHGISNKHVHDLRRVVQEYTDGSLNCVSLPGGVKHSSDAIASLFTLHEQGVLVPFIEHRIASGRFDEQRESIEKMVVRHHGSWLCLQELQFTNQ